MVPDSLSMGCQVSCVGLEPGNVTNLAIEKNIPIFGPCLGFSNEETRRAFHGAADRVVFSPKASEAASFKQNGAGRWLRQSSTCFISKIEVREIWGSLATLCSPNWCSLGSKREMSEE